MTAEPQITLVIDPLFDKDILDWIASFKPDQRNDALLMAIRTGMNTEELTTESLETRLDIIQESVQGLRDEMAKVRRDMKKAQFYTVENVGARGVAGEKVDLEDSPTSLNALNNLINQGQGS